MVLVLALGGAARAAEHPVELTKDADCASCHEDKTKGKYVHSAIAMGCTTCHEVKTEKGASTVNLVSPKNQLCFTCHAKEAKQEDTKHGPWDKGLCVLCHDPHTSAFPKQLRAQGNALCLECHAAGRGELPETVKLFNSQEVPRADLAGIRRLRLTPDSDRGHPFDNHPIAKLDDPTRPGEKMSCLSCHVPHFSPEDKLGRAVIVDKQLTNVCDACHAAVEAAARAAEEKQKPAVGSGQQAAPPAEQPGGKPDKPQAEKSPKQGAEKQ